MTSIIAVHGGAGSHSRDPSSENRLKHALKAASTPSRDVDVDSPLYLVEHAITSLENDPSFNAGYGSNLTYTGTVECDASITDEHGNFGSVGAVTVIANPISLAHAVLKYAANSEESRKLGRVPPLTLVSAGAQQFAASQNIEVLPNPETLISEQAKNAHAKWLRLLKDDEEEGEERGEGETLVQDTVGAVAFRDGRVAAGVSSGGILLKLPGRIGEAATYGAGCWACTSPQSRRKVAVSVSGTGEDIVRSGAAMDIAEKILAVDEGEDEHSVLQRILEEEIPKRNHSTQLSDIGALVLVVDLDGEGGVQRAHLYVAFTTESMTIGYASESNKPKAKILRQPKRTANKKSVLIECIVIK